MKIEILKAIEHIKNVSKKKAEPVKIFNYLQNNIPTSNYDYQSVVEKLQELISSGVIDNKYRIINPIVENQNLTQEDDMLSAQTPDDITITLSPTSPTPTELTTVMTNDDPQELSSSEHIESSLPISSQQSLNTPMKDDQQIQNLTQIQYQIDQLKEELENEINSNREFKEMFCMSLERQHMKERDEADILNERIMILEKENNCLKDEIKNQQFIIQMITKDNNGFEWKTITRKKSNANSQIPKPTNAPTPTALSNRFENLTVDKDPIFETMDNHDITPLRTIPNTKPKSRDHGRNASKTSHRNKRPEVAITENYVNSQRDQYKRIVPGLRTYANATEFSKKICVIGDSHVRRIRKNVFNNSLNDGRAYLNGFSGVNVKRLDHYITPVLEEDQPDIVIIHVGCNDITYNSIENIDVNDLSNRLLDIGKKCKSYGVETVIFSSILAKKQIKLTKVIRQVNDILQDKCEQNGFLFVNNDNVTREYLWKDGLHLNNDGTRLFAGNLVSCLNDFVFNRNT